MKNCITLLLLLLGLVLQAQNQDNFVGNWTATDGSVITIYTQDGSYYAKTNGEFILIQMVKKSEVQLYGGSFYDTKMNTEYEAKLKLSDNNTIRLKIIKGLSNEIIVWHRIILNDKEKRSVAPQLITTK